MKYNLHTHSFYCGHGTGEIYEYCQYAEDACFDLLGFSEHCPFPDDSFHSTRMAFHDMDSYENDVLQAKKNYDMPIFIGYECDYFPKWKSYFKALHDRVDYLISGTHYVFREDGTLATPFSEDFTSSDVSLYAKSFIKAMETGLFLFMAHPDVFLLYYKWDENAKAASIDILEAARSLDIPLEINANGIMKAGTPDKEKWGYPNVNFWLLASEYNIKALCSSDAHMIENLDKHYSEVWDFASMFDLDMVEPCVRDGKLVLKLRNQDPM